MSGKVPGSIMMMAALALLQGSSGVRLGGSRRSDDEKTKNKLGLSDEDLEQMAMMSPKEKKKFLKARRDA